MPDAPENEVAVADAVIAELKTECGSLAQAVGPIKLYNSVTLSDVKADIASGAVAGRITLAAYNESPHGDCYDSERSFDITLDDARRLAGYASKFRKDFEAMAGEMLARLGEERENFRSGIGDWCDQGLPTEADTAVMKPLRWKRNAP